MVPVVYFAAILFFALRLSCGDCVMGRRDTDGPGGLPTVALGWALSLSLAVADLICVVFDLPFPSHAMYESWAGLLPDFVWLTPAGFVIDVVETLLYGWCAALIFRGLYNAPVARRRPT